MLCCTKGGVMVWDSDDNIHGSPSAGKSEVVENVPS
mgnify:CR=1 FL=1